MSSCRATNANASDCAMRAPRTAAVGPYGQLDAYDPSEPLRVAEGAYTDDQYPIG